MSRKKVLALILSVSMMVSMVSVPTKAHTMVNEEIIYYGEEEHLDVSEDFDYENDDLLQGYLEEKMGVGGGISTFSSNYFGERLTGQNLIIYNYLKEEVKKIADGERDSSVIEIPITLLLDKLTYTAEELGVASIYEGGVVTQEAEDALLAQLNFDPHKIVAALLFDCPYELYWFEKTQGYNLLRGNHYHHGQTGGNPFLMFTGDEVTTFYFYLDRTYSVSGTLKATDVDTTATGRASIAAENAKSIVGNADGLSDINRLHRYREEICNLVSYDHDAADKGSATLGTISPWQLIYVFDGDESTNVVCEGYSKAFQYLCEMTQFGSDEIYSLLVTGDMNGGGHMWNVMHMEDGKSYLVDVTNCDEGTIGADTDLFLQGADSAIMDGTEIIGYNITLPRKDLGNGYYRPEKTISYQYDTEIMEIYDASDLTLAESDYVAKGPGLLSVVPESITGCAGTTLRNDMLADYPGWEWDMANSEDTAFSTTIGKKGSAMAVYTAPDRENYTNTTATVELVAAVHDFSKNESLCTNCGYFKAPSVTKSLTYGETLSTAGLSSGWKWVDSAVVPTVTNSGYDAQLDVSSTYEIYDYSKVTGYNSDTHKITRKVAVTVDKALPTASLFEYAAPADLTYSKTGKIPGVSLIEGENATYSLMYATKMGGVLSQEPPVNVGTYYVYAQITQADNYESGAVLLGSFSILPKTITVLPDTYSISKVHDGTTAPGVGNGGTFSLTGVVPGDTVKVTVLTIGAYTGSDAGQDYSVDVEIAIDNANYTLTNSTISVPASISIVKADPEYTKPVLTATCGDKLLSVSLAGTGFEWIDEDVTLTGGLEAEGQTVTKRAKYTPADTTNYNVIESVDLEIQVTHEVKLSNNGDKTHSQKCSHCDYEGTRQACSGGTATCNQGKVCEVCGYEYDTTPDLTKHDFYTVEGNDTTKEACTVCGIKNLAYEGLTVKGLSYIYTGKAQTPELTLLDEDNHVISTSQYEVTVDAKTVVGEYELTITAKEGSAYVGSQTVTWRIVKADPEYTKPVLTATCGEKLSTVSLTGTGFEWIDEDVPLTGGLEAEGQTVTKRAKYTPADTTNYNVIESVDLEIQVTHEVKLSNNGDKTHSEKCSHCDYEGTRQACSGGTATCYQGKICEVCGYEYDTTPDLTKHVFTTYHADNNATCVDNGTKTALCDNGCGAKDIIEDVDSSLGHHYGQTEFVWKNDGSACTIWFICDNKGCGNNVKDHKVSHACIVTSKTKKEPTCLSKGITTYTATYMDYSDNMDIVDIPVDESSHTYQNEICSRCGDIFSFTSNGFVYTVMMEQVLDKETGISETVPKMITTTDSKGNPVTTVAVSVKAAQGLAGEVTIPSTVKDDDNTKYTVTRVEENAFKDMISLVSVSIPETVTEIGSGAFSDSGVVTIHFAQNEMPDVDKDAFADSQVREIYVPVGAEGYDSLKDLVGINVKEDVINHTHDMQEIDAVEPGCVEDGNIRYYYCGACEKYFDDIDGKVEITDLDSVVIPSNGHHYVRKVISPTCEEAGYTDFVCDKCDDRYVANYVPALGHDYEDEITPATLENDGMCCQKCINCGNVNTADVIPAISGVKLSKSEYTYSGPEKKPKVTVVDRDGTVISNRYYTVDYVDNKDVGNATVTVTFVDEYAGSITKTFRIAPKEVTGVKVKSKIKGKTKTLDITWKKQTSQTTGYQIRYATRSDFKSAKTQTLTKNSTAKLTLKNLSAKKKYYIQVRTYKTVKVNGKTQKIYSDWSVKCKK